MSVFVEWLGHEQDQDVKAHTEYIQRTTLKLQRVCGTFALKACRNRRTEVARIQKTASETKTQLHVQQNNSETQKRSLAREWGSSMIVTLTETADLLLTHLIIPLIWNKSSNLLIFSNESWEGKQNTKVTETTTKGPLSHLGSKTAGAALWHSALWFGTELTTFSQDVSSPDTASCDNQMAETVMLALSLSTGGLLGATHS